MEDWDLGFALEALARAQAGSGDLDATASTLSRSRDVVAGIAYEEDRAFVESELAREPWFGLLAG